MCSRMLAALHGCPLPHRGQWLCLLRPLQDPECKTLAVCFQPCWPRELQMSLGALSTRIRPAHLAVHSQAWVAYESEIAIWFASGSTSQNLPSAQLGSGFSEPSLTLACKAVAPPTGCRPTRILEVGTGRHVVQELLRRCSAGWDGGARQLLAAQPLSLPSPT